MKPTEKRSSRKEKSNDFCFSFPYGNDCIKKTADMVGVDSDSLVEVVGVIVKKRREKK